MAEADTRAAVGLGPGVGVDERGLGIGGGAGLDAVAGLEGGAARHCCHRGGEAGQGGFDRQAVAEGSAAGAASSSGFHDPLHTCRRR